MDAWGAKAIIEAAKPVCVVPMHVKTKRCPYPIAPVSEFLQVMDAQDAQAVDSVELTKGHVPQGVLLMQPQADAL